MNIKSKQTQFEFFPSERSPGNCSKGRQPLLIKSLTLSIENIIVLCIIFIVITVISFSLGVERGKSFSGLIPRTEDSQKIVVRKSDTQEVATPSPKGTIRVELGQEEYSEKAIIGEQREIKKNEEIFKIPAEPGIIEESYFTIQVASFKTISSAQKEALGLKQKGYEIFVLPKGEYSIVCVGKFTQKNEAKQFSVKLKDRYSDCLVRRL